MKLRRLIALTLALLLCSSLMVPMASAAKYNGAAVPITLTVTANEKSNGSYDVRYKASLTMSESDAAAFASLIAGKSSSKLSQLSFVCVLGDSAIRSLTLTADELAAFTMTDSKNIYELSGVAEQPSDLSKNIKLVYKLNTATQAAWDNATAATIHDALLGQTVEFSQTTAKNVAASVVSGTITTDAYVDAYLGSTLLNSASHAAYGSTTMAKYPYSSGSGGSSSSGSASSGSTDVAAVKIVETDVQSGDVTSTANGEVNKNIGGTVTLETSTGKLLPGSKATVRVAVNPGRAIVGVNIIDKNGNRYAAEYKGAGAYEFTVPEAGVSSVDVQYKRVPYLPSDSGVNALLNTDEHILFTVGDGDGNWRPNATITRAEVAMMFYRLLRSPNVGTSIAFSDVVANAWYADAVKAISYLGIIKGYEDGTFGPDAAITRAEFVAMCVRFAKSDAVSGSREFADVLTNYWAYSEITKAEALGWIIGYPDGRFGPDNKLTRAEAATIINRMLGRPGDDSAIHSGAGVSFPDVPKDFWAYDAIIETTVLHAFDLDSFTYTESWKNA